MSQASASTMLAAMNHAQEVKSKAENAGTNLRDRFFFAQRSINSFQGGLENEMKTMIAALLGMKSYVSIETFHYMFIHDLVAFIDEKLKLEEEEESCDGSDLNSYSSDISRAGSEDLLHEECFDEKIDAMSKMLNEE